MYVLPHILCKYKKKGHQTIHCFFLSKDGIVNFGRIECFNQKTLCASLGMESGLKFYENDQFWDDRGTVIPSLNVQEIAKEVLALLPEMKKLDEETFKVSEMKIGLIGFQFVELDSRFLNCEN